MIALKLTGKIIAIFFEYLFLILMFIPVFMFLGIMQFVYAAIDNSSYQAKIQNTPFYDEKKKRELTDQKIDRDRDRRKTLADRLVSYWTEHLFK